MKTIRLYFLLAAVIMLSNNVFTAKAEYPVVSNKIITIDKVTNSSVTISWTKATDKETAQSALKYTVFYKLASATGWTSFGSLTDKSSCTIPGLTANTKYQIKILVSDEELKGGLYNVVEFTTAKAADTTNPVMTTVTVGTITSSTVSLSWPKATDNVTAQSALKYKVIWTSSHGFYWYESGIMTNVGSYKMTDLYSDTEYEIQVIVYDEAGNQAFYNVYATTKSEDTQAPTVSNKTVTVGTVTESSIALSWTKASDNITPQSDIKYSIFYDDPNGKTGQNVVTGASSYTIKNLDANATYEITVSAFDTENNKTNYNTITVKTKSAADIEAPTVSNKTILSTTTETSIKLSWMSAIDNVTVQKNLKYTILSKPPIGKTWITVGTLTGKSTYTVNSLSAGVSYQFKVTVEDEAGNTTTYNTVTATTKAAADTEAPTVSDKTITVTANSQKSVTITWKAATDNVTSAANMSYMIGYYFGHNMSTISMFYSGATTAMVTGKTSYTFTDLNLIIIPTSFNVLAIDEAGNKTLYTFNNVGYKVEKVSLNKTALSLEKGQKETLTATLTPADVSVKTIKWESSNTSVATVSDAGLVTAVGEGTATITATANDGSKASTTCAITVKAATSPVVSVTGVAIENTKLSLEEGETEYLNASVAPSTATNKAVSWKSSNTSVASVSSSGLVTALKAGTAVITVTTDDGSKTATCTVTVTAKIDVANENIEANKVYAYGGMLYISLSQPETVRIYNLSGQLVQSFKASAGKTSIPVSKGLYIVRVGDDITKVIVK